MHSNSGLSSSAYKCDNQTHYVLQNPQLSVQFCFNYANKCNKNRKLFRITKCTRNFENDASAYKCDALCILNSTACRIYLRISRQFLADLMIKLWGSAYTCAMPHSHTLAAIIIGLRTFPGKSLSRKIILPEK